MSDVKRYDFWTGMEGEINDMPDGEWVRFDDHLAALTAAQARESALEREVHALRQECCTAYEVIGALPDGALASVPEASLMKALRLMDREELREATTTGLDKQLAAAQARCERLEEALQASRVAITYAIGALQGGLADSERQYLINVLVNDEQAARAALEEPQ
jgi:hypothetical protein